MTDADQPTPPAPQPEPRRDEHGFRVHKERSIEQLRSTLSMLCNFIWHKALRPGEHLWSIPVDEDRDFDCILSDAISELETRRIAARADTRGAWRGPLHPDGGAMRTGNVIRSPEGGIWIVTGIDDDTVRAVSFDSENVSAVQRLKDYARQERCGCSECGHADHDCETCHGSGVRTVEVKGWWRSTVLAPHVKAFILKGLMEPFGF